MPDGNSLVDNEPDLTDPSFVAGVTDIEASNGIIQAIDRVLIRQVRSRCQTDG